MMYTPQRRKDDGFAKKTLASLRRIFTLTGALVIIGGFVFALSGGGSHEAAMPQRAVLTYTLKAGLGETAEGPTLLQPLPGPSRTFGELIAALDAAGGDARVRGLVVRLQSLSLSPAQIQELRDALQRFRAAGKFADVYAEDFGGMSGGMGAYYLASAFSGIWLQPVGAVSVNGVAAEVPFFKGMLDKIGVSAEFRHKGIYKSMPESLTEKGMTAPHRAMMTDIVRDLSSQFAEGIAKSRKIKPAEMKGIIDNAPYTAAEALKLKLVDRVGYYDELIAAAKTMAGRGADTFPLADYRPPHAAKAAKTIAVITGAGDIVSRSSTHAGLSGADMAADKIARAFDEAGDDRSVVAAVFRIDSPGGSPAAAETIRHAVQLFQKKGKPVIVSMSGYAASGGYWIAAPANKIVAEPATLTGSIGVFGGKFVLAGLWEKLGLRFDSVAAGENAEMWSSNKGFTDKQKARFDTMLADIYDSFVARVAEGRHLTPEAVRAIAEGRVWTGRQAKAVGLVDALGGMDKAVALARAAVHAPAGQVLGLKRFPAPKSPLAALMSLLNGEGDDDDDVRLLPALSIDPAALLEALQQQARQQEAESLKMQDIQLR